MNRIHDILYTVEAERLALSRMPGGAPGLGGGVPNQFPSACLTFGRTGLAGSCEDIEPIHSSQHKQGCV